MEVIECSVTNRGHQFMVKWSENVPLSTNNYASGAYYIVNRTTLYTSDPFIVKTTHQASQWRLYVRLFYQNESEKVHFVSAYLELLSTSPSNTPVNVIATIYYHDNNYFRYFQTEEKTDVLSLHSDLGLEFTELREVSEIEDEYNAIKSRPKTSFSPESPIENEENPKRFQRPSPDYFRQNREPPPYPLAVFCKLTLLNQIPIGSKSLSVPNLINDFSKLLEDNTLSDVAFTVDGKEIWAHKVILSARSPVFARMFCHNMSENIHNRVDVTDIEHDVLYELLRYIYTGSSKKMKKMAFRLYAAADKYALEELKAMCAEKMRSGLSPTNVVRVFIEADLHNDDKLKTDTISYLVDNLYEVITTPEFKAAVVCHPGLMSDALADVGRKKLKT